jgi:hypothetical protein
MVEWLPVGYLVTEARPMPIAAPVFSILLLGVVLLVDIIVIFYVINVSILLG